MRKFFQGLTVLAVLVGLLYLAFAFISLDMWWVTSEARIAYVGRLGFAVISVVVGISVFEVWTEK